MERLIELDEQVIRAGYELEDDWDPLEEAWDLFLSQAETSLPMAPMTLSVASVHAEHLDQVLRQQYLDALVPRRFFRISQHDSNVGEAFSALVGGRAPFDPAEPHVRWDLAAPEGDLKVVAIWSLCPVCCGTGRTASTGCTYRNPASGQACESGFLFEGGLRLDLGEPSETLRFGPPPQERFLAAYNA
ncbi:MAG: hypothetical protein EP330_01210 [Deltaproteobacteria bacterium]|nr:MAG: hypothetical protein EP330_01210 [Deltaproteobacteria bacterium]